MLCQINPDVRYCHRVVSQSVCRRVAGSKSKPPDRAHDLGSPCMPAYAAHVPCDLPSFALHRRTAMPWIEANGASLRYELSGAGPDMLVLMHEAGGCLESYEEALPGFEQDFRVLRYDQRGFGLSEKACALTFEGVVADLAALLEAWHITSAIYLAGCAMGADFAVGFASRHPQRVAKLALASPNIDPNGPRSAGSIERGLQAEREGIRAVMNASHDRSYPEHLRAP